MLLNKRSYHNEKPMHLEKSPYSNEDPAQPKIHKYILKNFNSKMKVKGKQPCCRLETDRWKVLKGHLQKKITIRFFDVLILLRRVLYPLRKSEVELVMTTT